MVGNNSKNPSGAKKWLTGAKMTTERPRLACSHLIHSYKLPRCLRTAQKNIQLKIGGLVSLGIAFTTLACDIYWRGTPEKIWMQKVAFRILLMLDAVFFFSLSIAGAILS